MSQVSQQFNLTQREREVMEYALQGLTSTAIAQSHEHQPKHREGLSADDHDQDGRVFPLGSGGQNYHEPTAVIGVGLLFFSSASNPSEVGAIGLRGGRREYPNRVVDCTSLIV